MEIFASWTGPDFLAFYAVMLATCVFLGLWIPANLREAGRKGSVEDLEEVAVLSGGHERHAAAILADLFTRGALTEGDKGKLRVARTGLDAGEAERAVLAKVGDFKLSEAKDSLDTHAGRVEARLIRRGLMMDAGERRKLALLSILPYLALLVIGLYRQQAGSAAGEPTGFLIGLMIVTAIFAAIRYSNTNPRTVAGNLLMREIEDQGSRMKRAPQAKEAGYAVAIFGTSVLVGTPWEPVHAARQAGSGDGGSSGDSGDSDGGGGCGGGCGGCGG